MMILKTDKTGHIYLYCRNVLLNVNISNIFDGLSPCLKSDVFGYRSLKLGGE